MNTVTIKIGKLFKAISLYENHVFIDDHEYAIKTNIKLQNEKNEWCNVPFLIRKKDTIVEVKYKNGKIKVGQYHKFVDQFNNTIFARDLKAKNQLLTSGGETREIVSTKLFKVDNVFDLQIDSLNHLYRTSDGLIHHNTLIMAAILKCYPKVKILCIFNTIDLIAQTYDKLKAYGFKPSEVGVIQGNNFDDTKRITLLSVQSYEKAYNLFTEVKVIICDEVHETGRTESSEKVIYSCQNAPIHIGLSATPWSDNDAETMRLYGNIGPIIYQKEFKEQMDSDYIAQTEVEIYSYQCDPIPPCGTWSDIYDVKKVNNTNTEEKLKRDGYTIVTEGGIRVGRLYVSPGDEYTHIINNEQRNKKIIDVIKKYVNQKKRILVIYNRVEHGEILKQLYPDAILIHGEHDISERKKAEYQLRENDATVVLASGIWRKGIDIEEVDVYINAAAGKASTNVIQKLGRVVRKSRTTDKETAIVVDFDDSNLSGIGRRQTAKRLKIYNDLKLPVRTL